MKTNITLLYLSLAILLIVGLSACALPLVKQAIVPSPTTVTASSPTTGIRVESLTPTANKVAVEQPTQTFPAVPQSTATTVSALPTVTNTPVITTTPASLALSPTPTAVSPSPTSTPIPSNSPDLHLLPPADLPLPTTYTLQKGEFPYCIARRYNVDQNELLHLNGMHHYGQIFFPGFILKMPQTGHHFISTRALHPHTSTYTVTRYNETVRSVACYFGDIDPAIIASINNLDVNAKLNIGQILKLTK